MRWTALVTIASYVACMPALADDPVFAVGPQPVGLAALHSAAPSPTFAQQLTDFTWGGGRPKHF